MGPEARGTVRIQSALVCSKLALALLPPQVSRTKRDSKSFSME